jgi:signal transduction histidine kinase/ligand-binding sensor domain-containing protein/DNA-binding response OmpR family regulator
MFNLRKKLPIVLCLFAKGKSFITMRLKGVALYLYLAFIFLGTASFANYRFAHLTIKEGLSQSTVKSIHQDWRGFLWFGSADGLNRFDGYNFTIYRNEPGKSSTLCGNDISCIYENPFDSTFWIGTQNDGLSLYCRNTDSFFSFRRSDSGKNALPSDNINSMVSVKRSELWIGTQGSGLTHLNLVDTTFSTPDFSNSDEFRNINTLLADKHGNLWLGTSGGLYKYKIPDKGNFSTAVPEFVPLDISVAPSINSLAADMRGNIWIGTSNVGLIRYHPESSNINHYNHNPSDANSIGSNSVRSIIQRKNGTIWIGTDNGLYNFDQQGNSFRAFTNDASDSESISDDIIFSLFEDLSGVLWLGTYFGGVNRVDPEESRFIKYTNFHKRFNLNKAANHVRSIYKDANNRLWVASSKGLILFSEEYFRRASGNEHAQLYFRETDQYYVIGDTYRNLYVSNSMGLFIKKDGDEEFKPLAPTNLDLLQGMKFVSHAIEDSDRMVWFFTSSGLLKYNPKINEAELYNPKNKKGFTTPVAFLSGFESYNGKIWCGTADGTIYRYDRYIYQFEKILPVEESRESIPYNRIFSIHETEPGSLWFGTNNGLYHYSDRADDLVRYLSSDGLSNNVVYSVLADKQKRIWCSTNLGISILDRTTNTFVNYTWEDGLQSNEFNQSAYFRSDDGLFYFGGIDGINIINPSSINPNPFIPPVVITGLSVNHEKVTSFSHPKIIERQITESQKIILKYNQAIFTFEFAALNYTHPNKNEYRYKLEGYDKEWITEGNLRTASYTNIPPGDYTFMVQGSNNSGIWNETPATIQVVILPPFWLTWWFKTLITLLLVSIIYLVIYFRLKGVKSKNEWLQKQVDEKTTALSEKNYHIEKQNLELRRINDEINQRNKKIEEKNQKLNQQNEQIAMQRDNLINLSSQLEEANQERASFFTNISHEFRTPLTLIIGPLKELLSNMGKISQSELIRKFNIIYANAAKLLTLINQLLDFRENEISSPQIKLSRIDIVRFIRDINFLFNDLASRKKISFVFTSVYPVLEVCFDPEKMEKVVSNLLSNAFKFTPDGGKIQITVEVSNSGDSSSEVIIKVSDNGHGIPEESLNLIFERFYHASYPGFGAGNGIGLSLVKRYVELHGGNVSVESRLGRGTKFKVSFPMIDDCVATDESHNNEKQLYNYSETISSAHTVYSPRLVKDKKTGEEYQLTKLVIIEDDNNFRDYLSDVLSERHRIFSAGTFAEGMELILSKHPDLIISDVNLPDKNGYELCQNIKENYVTCHIPVILLTSLSDMASQISGLKSGADAYIIKPFELQFLAHTIDNLIALRKRMQSKYYFDTSSESLNHEVKSGERLFLDKVIKEIEKNIHDSEFDVEKLCKALGLSQPQTYRKIKAITDLSISEFIRNTRLKKAARMFSENNLTVSEVAYQVGFSDPNYFTKCFTRLFGQTPTDYLKLRGEIG